MELQIHFVRGLTTSKTNNEETTTNWAWKTYEDKLEE